MKRLTLFVLMVCLTLLAACAAPPTVKTSVGEFEMSQEVMDGIEDEHGNSLKPAEGNALLVVYVTPAKGNNATEDEVQAFFNSGTQVIIENESYDLNCMAFEKTGGRLRYGLVFEVPDKGYETKQPDFQLSIPQSAPVKTAAPTATPGATPAESITTTAPETDASPTASTETSS